MRMSCFNWSEKPVRALLCLLCSLMFIRSGRAVDTGWFNRAWQSDEGLPDNSVVGIEQTPDDYLWVATQAGMARFDGIRFQQYSPATMAGVPTSLMQATMVDRSGRLWIAKERGIVLCLDRGGIKVFRSRNPQVSQEARLVVEDSAGAVWVSYIGGEVERIQNNEVRMLGPKEGLSLGGTCQLAADKLGKLWFSQGEWVGIYQKGEFKPLVRINGQRITGASYGGVWICKGKELFRYREGDVPVKVGELPTDRLVNPTILYEDRLGILWIGTKEAGLFNYNGSTFSAVLTSHRDVLSIKEDREGNMWIGTRGGGLNQLRPRIVELLITDPRGQFESVRSVCEDRSGMLWAVTGSGVVIRKKGDEWKPLGAADGWTQPYARCITSDGVGGVWIGTQYQGVYHWRDGVIKTEYSRGTGWIGDFVSALHTTAKGELWVAIDSVDGQQHGVYRITNGKEQLFSTPPGSGQVMAMTSDTHGNCWLGTSSGYLLEIYKNSMVNHTLQTLESPQAIRCLLAQPDDSLWIGYAGEGIGRFKNGKFFHCRTDQGIHDDYISQILSDSMGRFWFAGNRGIFYVHQKELTDLAEGGRSRVQSVAYGRNEGLTRLQTSHESAPGAVCASDKKIWIAMQSGLALVNAPALEFNPMPPGVEVERVIVNGKTVAEYQPSENFSGANLPGPLDLSDRMVRLSLGPGRNDLEFNFTALSFDNPESIQFNYMLEGLKPEWVDSKSLRMAYYPHLDPGTYRFRLRACNRDSIWNESAQQIQIIVTPYWWETIWFRVAAPLLFIMIILGSIISFVRRRSRRQIEILRLHQATDRERARIAQDLHDDLGAGLTQISLNTAMVQNTVTNNDFAIGLLKEIDHRARELVTALDEIVWALNPKNDTVSSLARYICDYAQSYLHQSEIACRLEVEPNLPEFSVNAEQRHQLFLSLKEALHNALRHSGASELKLEIKVESPPSSLLVTLTDDGRGFGSGPFPEGADGLGNMKARLQRVGGICMVTSSPGRGTKIMFQLPLEND